MQNCLTPESGPDIESWLRRRPARSLSSLLCQAVHHGETTTLRPGSGVGTYGKKDIHKYY